MSQEGQDRQGLRRKDAEDRVPWIKCVGCGQRILFRIRMHKGVLLDYQARRKTFFKASCSACGRVHSYKATQVHFEEVSNLPPEATEFLPPRKKPPRPE